MTARRISQVPKVTILWTAGWILGLALILLGASAKSQHPPQPIQALASAPAEQPVEVELQSLAKRVAALESEVARLQASPVVTRRAALNREAR